MLPLTCTFLVDMTRCSSSRALEASPSLTENPPVMHQGPFGLKTQKQRLLFNVLLPRRGQEGARTQEVLQVRPSYSLAEWMAQKKSKLFPKSGKFMNSGSEPTKNKKGKPRGSEPCGCPWCQAARPSLPRNWADSSRRTRAA